jgi:hypothetical protein
MVMLDGDEDDEKVKDLSPASSLTTDALRLDTVKILMNDWQWRHQHCWKSLQRFGLAAITVAVIPYAKSELFQENLATLFFPIGAWFVALAAVLLFAAEYVRCKPIEDKYYALLGDDSPIKTKPKKIGPSVGKSTIFSFVVGATLLSIGNAWILLKVINVSIWAWAFIGWASLSLIISLIIAWKLSDWSLRMIDAVSQDEEATKSHTPNIAAPQAPKLEDKGVEASTTAQHNKSFDRTRN